MRLRSDWEGFVDADQVADGLAVVCDKLTDIRTCLEEDGDVAVLDRFLEAVRAGGPTAAALDDLHAALQAAGDEVGIYSGTRGDTGAGPAPHGIGPSRPAEVIYLCPVRRCSRYWWPDSPAPPPVCALAGEPLRAERL
jgi:hypothetical protein